MKKIQLSIFALSLMYTTFSAQNASLPEPTTGSLSNYVNTAISPATGVPNIGIPIYQLESSNKEFPVNISLSYHVYNAKSNVPASEVGQGWSMFTSGVITRQEISDIDETKDWTDINEEQADLFYYTIPGHSGKFKIYRDAVTGNPVLNNMTGEKVKIEYERDLSGTKFIINSFKITDDNGFQYFFEDYNVGLARVIPYRNYKTSFVLTKVKDPGGNEIVNYSYDKKIKYSGTSTSLKKYQYCKINTISTAKGKLKFDYSYEEARDGEVLENDPYKLNSVSLTDSADRLISKHQFVYGFTGVLAEEYLNGILTDVLNSRRALSTILKLDKNLAADEETQLEYDSEGSGTQYGYYDDMKYGNFLCTQSQPVTNPKRYTMGLLKKITFPTKGSVVYDFEANTIYADKTAPDYVANHPNDPEISYYEETEISYDTNISRNYQFQVTVTQPIYFKFSLTEEYSETDIHGNPVIIKYEIKNASNVIVSPSGSECSPSFQYNLQPGTYSINIVKGGGNGTFNIYQLKTIPAPYKNEDPVKTGARVKMIQSFNTDGTLVKTKKFDYQSFSDTSGSFGEVYYNENNLNFNPYDGFVLYKNVKETEIAGTENNGYIKYYFKTPNDYVLPPNTGYFPYYNLTSGGVMEKKEVYNSQNQLRESAEYDYNFQEITGVPETNIAMGTTKPSWLQYTKETDTSYLGQASYQSVKESTFSTDNFQEILTKSTTPEGDITEVITKYASDLGNTRFLNNNMISVPLQVETKSNGEVISKAITKYDNVSHFYPTSLEVTDLAQVSETPATFDLYDDKGNLIQSTDKVGNSVITIWGYHKTLPIAQITGAKYSDISSVPAIAAAIAASDADAADPANEGALLTALENLRLDAALQPYSISVNTYDPLIGVTNSVSANGIKQSYEYTTSGKLYRVKNANGQVIKENQYNYKH
jgi:hypothetical protein